MSCSEDGQKKTKQNKKNPPRPLTNFFASHLYTRIGVAQYASHFHCPISVSDICKADCRSTYVGFSAKLSNVTFLRATVAFSTAEYVPGSSHSCDNGREPRMIKTVYCYLYSINVWHVSVNDRFQIKISSQSFTLDSRSSLTEAAGS